MQIQSLTILSLVLLGTAVIAQTTVPATAADAGFDLGKSAVIVGGTYTF